MDSARLLFRLSASVCGLGLLSLLLNTTTSQLFMLSLIGTACAAVPTVFLLLWMRAHSVVAMTRRLNERLAPTNSSKAR